MAKKRGLAGLVELASNTMKSRRSASGSPASQSSGSVNVGGKSTSTGSLGTRVPVASQPKADGRKAMAVAQKTAGSRSGVGRLQKITRK